MPHRMHIEEIEEEAALFALGALPPDETKRFSERLAAGCPLCRAEVAECQAALSCLAEAVPEATPSPGLRDRLLARITSTETPKQGSPEILIRAADMPWKLSPFPGVEMRYLLERKTMLVRMQPKARIPAHPHPSGEQCLVLEGSVSSNGVTAYTGDFVYMPAGSSHDDVYSEDGALFLIAYS